jgi:TonB-linked SusC/RagA family outer membrane protein
MARRHVRWAAPLALIAALVAPAPSGAAQEARGTITGRVTDRATGQPLAGAQVFIVGTQRRTVTGDEGSYRLASVPSGRVQLRVARLGYGASTQETTLAAGATATLDFALTATATTLGEVLVTATGAQQLKRENPASVGTIAPSAADLAATPSFSDVLSARTPGVVVHQASGTTGGGSRIRIRGSNSVSLANDPLIIVDGVRLNSALNSTTIGVGGQQPSRLNDINPEDIERIEVIKGPAAASLYGTAAANGVIQITTKRGRPGRTRWTFYSEGGSITEPTAYPTNFQQIGQVAVDDPEPVPNCTLDLQARALCVAKSDSLLAFNPLEQASPFRDGWRGAIGASASGGGDVATYYVAGDYEREQGVYDVNHLRRINLRANLRGQLRENLDVTVTTGYLSSRLRLPQNDNNILGVISSGLLGIAVDCSPRTPCGEDTVSRGYVSGQHPNAIFAIETRQDVEKFTGGVNSNWQPLGWLNVVGTAGVDFLSRYDNELVPPGKVDFGDLPLGERTSNPYQIFTYTANAGATASYAIASALTGASSVGVQYNNEVVRGTEAFGARLLAGTGSLRGTSERFDVDETNTENVTIGGYLQQQLNYRDRLYLTAAIRGDDNSAFGSDFGFVTYPSIGAAWVLSEEGFFPQSDWVSDLRLRASYGTSGQQPSFRDAISFFTPVSVVDIGGENVPAPTLGGTGNPELKPEKSSEFEAGLDVSLFRERVGLELTYYDKTTRDALIATRIPPSVGATQTVFQNIGRVSNRGVEVLVNARVLDLPSWKWDVTFNGSTNRNRLETLGLPAPIIFNGDRQRHTENRPLGAFYQRRFTFDDRNGDGIISRVNCPGQTALPGGPECEVTVGDTAYLGTPFPTRELSINSTLTLFRWVTVSGLLAYQGGHKQFNLTQRFRCVGAFTNCREVVDSTAPLPDQARAIAGLMGTDAGFIEDATFWKLRELSVTLALPERYAAAMRASSASLTLAGRNLATWSDYSGFDPEVNSNAQNNYTTLDFLTQPPVRYYVARLNLTF